MDRDDWGFSLGVAAGFIDTIYFETSFIESLSASVILASIAFYCITKERQILELETQAFVRQNERFQKECEDASRTWRLKAKQALKGMSNTFNSEYHKKRYADLADSLDRVCLTGLIGPIAYSDDPGRNLTLYLELSLISCEVKKGEFNKFPEVVDAWKDLEKSAEKLSYLCRTNPPRDPRLDYTRFAKSDFLFMFTFLYLFLVGIFSILGMLFL